MNENYVITIP